MRWIWSGQLLCMCWSHAICASPYTIAMFYPHDAAFWNMFTSVMKEAARDLGIDLERYNARDNRFEMVRQVNQVIQRPDKVDAMVFINYKHNGPLMIQAAMKPASLVFWSIPRWIRRSHCYGGATQPVRPRTTLRPINWSASTLPATPNR